MTLQPGPVYFLVPRKCGVFGVCCEGVPQQVNYLINEPHCIRKGSAAVISYPHHFFSQYGLGEKHVQCFLYYATCSFPGNDTDVNLHFEIVLLRGSQMLFAVIFGI